MKITNGMLEGLTRTDVLTRLLNCETLPVKVSYQLAKLSKLLDESLKFYLQEKNKILDRYCKKDDNGKFIVVDNSLVVQEGKEEQFHSTMREMFEIENDIPMERVKINLDDIPKGIVSPANFAFLELFIEFVVE